MIYISQKRKFFKHEISTFAKFVFLEGRFYIGGKVRLLKGSNFGKFEHLSGNVETLFRHQISAIVSKTEIPFWKIIGKLVRKDYYWGKFILRGKDMVLLYYKMISKYIARDCNDY